MPVRGNRCRSWRRISDGPAEVRTEVHALRHCSAPHSVDFWGSSFRCGWSALGLENGKPDVLSRL